ncbi:Appetite-regulating hormone [Galemys pyrenaicus]|uniref:Appetite-regulating hormone n=1 Tax=Galemys pyrenaicus TaxID=202257 RepID=A0A8J6DPA2_GALPY|nr:Appetite-regulating hormone [Galemys pyrenaicus]
MRSPATLCCLLLLGVLCVDRACGGSSFLSPEHQKVQRKESKKPPAKLQPRALEGWLSLADSRAEGTEEELEVRVGACGLRALGAGDQVPRQAGLTPRGPSQFTVPFDVGLKLSGAQHQHSQAPGKSLQDALWEEAHGRHSPPPPAAGGAGTADSARILPTPQSTCRGPAPHPDSPSVTPCEEAGWGGSGLKTLQSAATASLELKPWEQLSRDGGGLELSHTQPCLQEGRQHQGQAVEPSLVRLQVARPDLRPLALGLPTGLNKPVHSIDGVQRFISRRGWGRGYRGVPERAASRGCPEPGPALALRPGRRAVDSRRGPTHRGRRMWHLLSSAGPLPRRAGSAGNRPSAVRPTHLQPQAFHGERPGLRTQRAWAQAMDPTGAPEARQSPHT